MIIALLNFLGSFTLCFVGIPYLRLYVDPDLPRKYKLEDDVEALIPLGFVSGFLAWIFPVLLTLAFQSRWDLLNPIAIGFGVGLGIILHPLYLLHLLHKRSEDQLRTIKLRKLDKSIVEMAIKCGGVLSPLHLVKELGITIEEAIDSLERLVKLGEEKNIWIVERKQIPELGTIYIFRSVMALLADIDRRIVETLSEYPDGLTKSELFAKIGIPLKSLEESLSRLISKGIIVTPTRVEDRYQLRGLTY